MLLTEHERSGPHSIPWATRIGLKRTFTTDIVDGPNEGTFWLKPGGIVGSTTINGERIVVRPKLPISRVLFLVAYAADPYQWQEDWTAIASATTLDEGVAALFVRVSDRTLGPGLLRDYRPVQTDQAVVRGRVRWPAQAGRMAPVPIAVRFDVHDDDVIENQLIRAAVERLRHFSLHSDSTRAGLQRTWRRLSHLSPLPNPHLAYDRVVWTRRNDHLRPLLGLCRLILDGASLNVDAGQVTVTGFTLRLADVFERFLRVAVRQALGLPPDVLRDAWDGELFFDTRHQVRLLPDLAARNGNRWLFAADAKYKIDGQGTGRNDDLYQLFAYATAMKLRDATLIYAQGPTPASALSVAETKVTLHVEHLDLETSPDDILRQVNRIASRLAEPQTVLT